jgi:hypothetical protein
MRHVFALLCGILLITSFESAHADGFSTSFVDVAVLDVPLGAKHKVINERNESMLLFNLGDRPIHVIVQARVPEPQELKGNAQPVSDSRWVEIIPGEVEIPSRGKAEVTVILRLPKDRRLKGQLFQATIESRTPPPAGNGIKIQPALRSRLRFNVKK